MSNLSYPVLTRFPLRDPFSTGEMTWCRRVTAPTSKDDLRVCPDGGPTPYESCVRTLLIDRTLGTNPVWKHVNPLYGVCTYDG